MTKVILSSIAIFILASCSIGKVEPRPEDIKVEYYDPAYRQLPPEPVYKRTTYSYLPAPVPLKTKSQGPLIAPKFTFELIDSNLSESVEALSQAMGFRWKYPSSLASRRVSINMTGSPEDILKEISRQTKTTGRIDYKQRKLVVTAKKKVPGFK